MNFETTIDSVVIKSSPDQGSNLDSSFPSVGKTETNPHQDEVLNDFTHQFVYPQNIPGDVGCEYKDVKNPFAGFDLNPGAWNPHGDVPKEISVRFPRETPTENIARIIEFLKIGFEKIKIELS